MDTLGVEFISLRERFDTTSPTGKLIMTILMALNQFEREQVSLRTRANIQARTMRGLWFGGRPPLGYVASQEHPGHLEIDEEAAEITRLIYAKYLELGSVSTVCSYLDKSGIKRPGYLKRDGELTPHKRFTDSAIRSLLSNPTLSGYREVNREKRKLSESASSALLESERYHLV